jgi:cell wall-associated NlpC family hydrolase
MSGDWLPVVAPVAQGGLLGAPFLWGGRGPQAYDCWGLVREAYLRVYGQLLPEWMVPDGDLTGAMRIMQAQAALWQPADLDEPGAILFFSRHRAWHHVGIRTPWGVLHSVKPSVAHPTLAQIRGLYPHLEAHRWAP